MFYGHDAGETHRKRRYAAVDIVGNGTRELNDSILPFCRNVNMLTLVLKDMFIAKGVSLPGEVTFAQGFTRMLGQAGREYKKAKEAAEMEAEASQPSVPSIPNSPVNGTEVQVPSMSLVVPASTITPSVNPIMNKYKALTEAQVSPKRKILLLNESL